MCKKPAVDILRMVVGQWTVPSVSPPPSRVVWLGIDGTKGTNDVPQAGTLSRVNVSGGVITGTSYQVRTEWFGSSWIVQSLAVSPGDLISCTVCAPFGNTHGMAVFTNM
jgi:Peptidase A4 family